MKKQFITLVALAVIPAFSFAQTADEVLTKHVTALGGADKIAAIKTMEYEQTMSVQGMDITSKAAYVVGKSVRNDVSVMGQQITNVIDGDKGWTINPMSGGTTAQDMPADAMKMAKSTTEPNMFQLAYLKSNKYPYELVGKEKQNDKDVYNIKVTRPEGTFNYYIDAANYQLLGLKGNTFQGEISATFSDYKQTDNGLTIPYTSEMNMPNVPAPVTARLPK